MPSCYPTATRGCVAYLLHLGQLRDVASSSARSLLSRLALARSTKPARQRNLLPLCVDMPSYETVHTTNGSAVEA